MEHDRDNIFKDFIYNQLGISISNSNFDSVKRHIKARMTKLNMDKKHFYNRLLNDEEERQAFFNVSTICETYFFREEKQFYILKNHILPELLSNQKSIKLWSVTCSGGEEALSLALLLKSMINDRQSPVFTVYGTDINSCALEKCAKFTYTKNSLRRDGKQFEYLIEEYFDSNNKKWVLKDKMKKHIKITCTNIFKDDLGKIPDNLDIIFFRNTLIYMEEKNKKYIIDKIIKKLRPNGYLFLGTTETAFINHKDLLLVEKDSVYYFKKLYEQSNNEDGERVWL